MENSPPRLSVIMPTLNVREYIEESTTAVLNQSFSDLELLILDGGSTDGTVEFCESINDKRVKVFRNAGDRIEARQYGVKKANGDLLAIVDADTVPDTSRFKKAIDFLDENGQFAAVGSYVRRIEPDGATWTDKKPTSYQEIKQQLVRSNSMVHPTMVMRVSAVKSVGGYRRRRYEDYDLVIRLAEEYKLANQDEILVDYYIRDEGTIQTTTAVENTISTLRCNYLAIKTLSLPAHLSLFLFIKRFIIEFFRIVYNTLYYNRKK